MIYLTVNNNKITYYTNTNFYYMFIFMKRKGRLNTNFLGIEEARRVPFSLIFSFHTMEDQREAPFGQVLPSA